MEDEKAGGGAWRNILNIVSREIGKNWLELGRYLGHHDCDLESLNSTNSDLPEKAYQMLRMWQQTFPDQATLDILIKALVNVRRNDIVKKIEGFSTSAQNEEFSAEKDRQADSSQNKMASQDLKAMGNEFSPKQHLKSNKRSELFDAAPKTATLASQVKANLTRRHYAFLLLPIALLSFFMGNVYPQEQISRAVTSLSTYTANQNSHLLADVRDILTDEYLDLTMKGLPWMKELELSLEEYYVDLTLEKMNKHGIDLSSETINIDCIFTPVDKKKKLSRILIEGGPGMGKSTFAAKLAYDWAKRQAYMEHFDLVVLIPLKQSAGELKDVLFNALPIQEKNYKRMLRIFDNSSNHILFIMDGYDEISTKMKSTLMPLLHREIYPHITVILTSRPGNFSFNQEAASKIRKFKGADFSSRFYNFIQKRIKIKGFTEHQQKMFVTKHTRSCSEKEKQRIMLKLDKIVDKHFSKCPLFLLMLVITFTDNLHTENPLETKTELYKQVFNCVFRRYYSKLKHHSISEIDLFSYNGSNKPPHIALMEHFSNFSFWAISSNRASFSYDEIIKNANGDSRIVDIGLLMQSVTVNRLREQLLFEPVHKSLLEFAAAYSLWLSFAEGKHHCAQWEKYITPKIASLKDSLCYYFLEGLIGENALLKRKISIMFYEKQDDNITGLKWGNVITNPFLLPLYSIVWKIMF